MVSECDRIAKVLREHATTIGGCCLCSFNCAPNTNDTHAEHVAAAVLDALELQEEWTALPREHLHLGAPKLFPSHAAAKAHRDGWVPGWVLFSRLVSRWVGEETKP